MQCSTAVHCEYSYTAPVVDRINARSVVMGGVVTVMLPPMHVTRCEALIGSPVEVLNHCSWSDAPSGHPGKETLKAGNSLKAVGFQTHD